jgi:hypothetical protein
MLFQNYHKTLRKKPKLFKNINDLRKLHPEEQAFPEDNPDFQMR